MQNWYWLKLLKTKTKLKKRKKRKKIALKFDKFIRAIISNLSKRLFTILKIISIQILIVLTNQSWYICNRLTIFCITNVSFRNIHFQYVEFKNAQSTNDHSCWKNTKILIDTNFDFNQHFYFIAFQFILYKIFDEKISNRRVHILYTNFRKR